MSSRAGALIDVESASGAWLMWASATETEESPLNGRLPSQHFITDNAEE